MVAITGTVQSSSLRIKIDVTGGPSYGYITRVNSITGEIEAVRGAAPIRLSSLGAGTVYDYEAPRDVPVVYKILNVQTGPLTLDSLDQIVFLNPFDPTEYIFVEVIDKPDLSMDSRNVVTYPLGSSLPVATTQTLQAATSDMKVLAQNKTEADKYRKMLIRGAKFLYAPPAIVDDQAYVALTGTVTETRADEFNHRDPGRIFSFTISIVRGPSLLGSEVWNYGTLARRYASINNANAAYLTYDNMRDDVLI